MCNTPSSIDIVQLSSEETNLPSDSLFSAYEILRDPSVSGYFVPGFSRCAFECQRRPVSYLHYKLSVSKDVVELIW